MYISIELWLKIEKLKWGGNIWKLWDCVEKLEWGKERLEIVINWRSKLELELELKVSVWNCTLVEELEWEGKYLEIVIIKEYILV